MAAPIIPILLILSCALVGGYGGMYTSIRDGFMEDLRICTTTAHSGMHVVGKCILHVPDVAYIPAYTGFPAVDSRLAVLLEHFAQGMTSDDGRAPFESMLSAGYLAAHYGGAWCLMALEGLRRRNAGTLLSYTGTFGMLCQLLTFTIAAPIYFILQLLLSPQPADQAVVAVDELDLTLLPVTTTIAYVLPTIGLAMPMMDVLSPSAKYLAIALWQPFPIYQTVVHTVLRAVSGGGKGGAPVTGGGDLRQYKQKLANVYTFVIILGMAPHLLALGTLLLSYMTDAVPMLSLRAAFVPHSLFDPPTSALSHPPVPAGASRDIVASFLRWDLYSGCAALVIWAAYLSQPSSKTSSIVVTTGKAVLWTVLGGPVASAALLLWERDLAVLERSQPRQADEKQKSQRRALRE